MNRDKFEEIYVNYEERHYAKETTESVRRCYIPYEQKEQAVKDAKSIRKMKKQDAINDTIDFFNCLKRSYCGYDYFFTDETCEIMQASIIRKIEGCRCKISSRRLYNLLYDELKSILNDSHFEMYLCYRSRYFQKQYIAYVTDIILCKVDNGYEIVKGNKEFSKGHFFSNIDVEEFLMPTLYTEEGSDLEKEYYLLGKYSGTKVKALFISGKKLKTHRIRSDFAKQNGGDRFTHKKGYAIVTHERYGMPWNESLFEEFYKEGCACKKESSVILNLTGNGGGSSEYPARFYLGLCGTGENYFEGAYLTSPKDIQDDRKRYSYIGTPSCTPSEYEGTLYVIMNKSTASSAEMGISSSYHLKNAVRVGSSSFGCCTFGNCAFFQLPNSKILCRYGNRLFHYDNFEEGKGFIPDFWIDDLNPVGVVEEYIKMKNPVNR